MHRAALVAALLLGARPARAQQAPDTPAAQRLTGWLEAFNADRPEALRQFVQVHVVDSARHRTLEASPATADFRARTGGFVLRKVEESTASHLSALVQERQSDRVARLVMNVEPAAPHRITSMTIGLVEAPRELAIERMSEAGLVAALREKATADAAAGRFAGAVLVARDGRTLFEGAYGLADRSRNVSNTLDTRFRIGSMNKMFTAVAALQLVQAGKLRLDAPVGTYLRDYPNKDVASKVTIHHLLTHTGGTGDFFGPEFDANRLSLRTLHDYVALFGKRGLAFEPGSRWDYSNYGFLLLGEIIEKVSGTSYYDYVASHVFAPAGMTATASLPEDTAVSSRAMGYMRDESSGAQVPNTPTLPYRGTSAGGGYSTVRDLSRFAAALRDHKLLDAAHSELLTTAKVDTPNGKYAYGFQDRMVNGARIVGHGGGAPGMNGDLAIDPRSGYVTVVLSNLDPPAAQRISEFVVNRLPLGAPTP